MANHSGWLSMDSGSNESGQGYTMDCDAVLATNSSWTNISLGNCSGNATTELLPIPSYYSMPYRVAGCLFVSIIFIIGFVGNVMVVIVVSRTRSMHTPTNCYLVSLAIADIMLLVSAPLPTIAEYFLIIDQSLLGAVGCAIMVFCQYLGVNVSSLSITAFTVERYIAICHPMRAQTMCTVKRAKRIIAALWLFGICYCVPWLVLITTKPIYYRDGSMIETCTFKLARANYLTYYMTDLVIFYIIPLLLTCILYGLIGRILFTSTIPSTPGKAINGVNGGKKSSSSRVQVIKMLAVVVGMFATLWMPYRVYVVYNSFAKQRYQDLWFLLFCRIMVYMNSAINPILYNAMSVKFRRAFKRLLYCGKGAEKAAYLQYTQVSHAPGDHVEMKYNDNCVKRSPKPDEVPSGLLKQVV